MYSRSQKNVSKNVPFWWSKRCFSVRSVSVCVYRLPFRFPFSVFRSVLRLAVLHRWRKVQSTQSASIFAHWVPRYIRAIVAARFIEERGQRRRQKDREWGSGRLPIDARNGWDSALCSSTHQNMCIKSSLCLSNILQIEQKFFAVRRNGERWTVNSERNGKWWTVNGTKDPFSFRFQRRFEKRNGWTVNVFGNVFLTSTVYGIAN